MFLFTFFLFFFLLYLFFSILRSSIDDNIAEQSLTLDFSV